MNWTRRAVSLKFALGDLPLFDVKLPMQTRSVSLRDQHDPVDRLRAPTEPLVDGSRGFCIRCLPVARSMPTVSRDARFLCYVMLQYEHCYVDLRQPFDAYEAKFSAKTRSTIKRKVRRYAEHCGGAIRWKTYTSPSEMRQYFDVAREVSKRTYQERRLDAGLPDFEGFMEQLETLAAADSVRGYVLFDGERPVSYLHCPIVDGVVTYAYLGYDPEFAQYSVGTVLQWLALEQLFNEARFDLFDFTEGQSMHKRLFATHRKNCVNAIFLPRSARNAAIVYGHLLTDRVSKLAGDVLEAIGAKAKVRRLLRLAGTQD